MTDNVLPLTPDAADLAAESFSAEAAEEARKAAEAERQSRRYALTDRFNELQRLLFALLEELSDGPADEQAVVARMLTRTYREALALIPELRELGADQWAIDRPWAKYFRR